MSNLPSFVAYAGAFEKAFENDVWDEVEACFAEEAVYEIGLPLLGAERCQGRGEIVAWFKDVLDRFDRRFDSRELTLIEGPIEDKDAEEVWLRGAATYRSAGVPDFVLSLKETLRFEDGLIVHLEDEYTEEMVLKSEAYVRDYAAKLGVQVELRAT